MSEPESAIAGDFLGIKGLRYQPDLLSSAEQVRVLAEIDAKPWQDDLKRRVQHHG